MEDGTISESQFQDFLRINIDNDVPYEDIGFILQEINEFFNGNFANIKSIEYLDVNVWYPILGPKEVQDEFQFWLQGVTKYIFRDGNVHYVGWEDRMISI